MKYFFTIWVSFFFLINTNFALEISHKQLEKKLEFIANSIINSLSEQHNISIYTVNLSKSPDIPELESQKITKIISQIIKTKKPGFTVYYARALNIRGRYKLELRYTGSNKNTVIHFTLKNPQEQAIGKYSLAVKDIIHTANSFQTQLKKEISEAVHSMSAKFKLPQTIFIAVENITYQNSGLSGPFAWKLQKILQTAIKEQKAFRYVKKRGLVIQTRVKIKNEPHTLEAKYGVDKDKLIVYLNLRLPSGRGFAKEKVSIPISKTKEVYDFLPKNSKSFARSLKALGTRSIKPKRKSFSLEMTTDRGKKGVIYKHGERLKLQIKASRDCYLHIYYLQNNGEILQIFPNEFHHNNKITAEKIYNIPDENYLFDFTIDCSKTRGQEAIKAIASIEPLPQIRGANIGYGIKGIKLSPKKIMETYRKDSKVVEVICTVLTVK